MAATTSKKGSKINFSEEINATVSPTLNPEIMEVHDVPKKGGRPSNGEVKKISLSIPVEFYDGVEIGAALFFKGNKTAYINALIKKDLEINLEKYKEFKAMTGK